MRTHYEATETMAEACDRYFQVNQFGADGGYGDAWVDFKLGPIPMPFPNTASRVRALRFHDLHHVLTGYDTDTLGEFEISAWEIGAGCRDYVAAWVLNLGGMTAGLVSAPRRTYAAFARGRRMRTLYGQDLDQILGSTVGEVRARFDRVAVDEPRALTWGWFALACVAGLAIGLPLLALVLALMPFGLLSAALRRRSAAAVG